MSPTQEILDVITRFLLQYPDLVETLGGVHQMMENRVAMFGRLSKLHGKLELMLAQVNAKLHFPFFPGLVGVVPQCQGH